MRTENVIYFSDTDWDFISLLAETGIGLNQAKMLVFLDRNGEATSRDIERGADMRQPEVNTAGRKFLERGWVSISEKKSEGKTGRIPRVYRLIKSFRLILDDIEKETKAEAQKELGLIKKMRNCQ
ncbi:MAG: ArsR family transcriptional regulator [Methanoregula sp.]|jgi:predicted transcriptional regulator